MVGAGLEVLEDDPGDRARAALRYDGVDQALRAVAGDVLCGESRGEQVVRVVGQAEIEARIAPRGGAGTLSIAVQGEGDLRGDQRPGAELLTRRACVRAGGEIRDRAQRALRA